MFFTRLLHFITFTLREYLRSGRALVEASVIAVAFLLLFRRASSPMALEAFFSLAGMLTLGLAIYSSSTFMGLSNRPQGYMLLTRKLGRSGYLLGYYVAALAVIVAAYLALSVLCVAFQSVENLNFANWLLGSLPLLLNAALAAATMILVAPIVMTPFWRLTLLAGVAIAFSGSLFNSQTVRDLAPLLRNLLGTLQVVFSAPLLPLFSGFALAVSRDYSGANIAIPLAQLSLTLGILALALSMFGRREIMFQG